MKVMTSKALPRYIFDTLANYIMAIIMINIVAGVIIDTFGQLR